VKSSSCVKQPKQSKQPREKAKMNYLNNKDMLIQFKESKRLGRMTPEFANMMVMLTRRYASRANFMNYTFNEDMQGEALLNVARYWQNFNPDKSDNPFAYFTQTIKNSFFGTLKKEKDFRVLKSQLGLTDSEEYGDDPETIDGWEVNK
jgi:DNA-directed RNA polymerase specialized sigma24 family protein